MRARSRRADHIRWGGETQPFVIARSVATKQSNLSLLPSGLLRFARNDVLTLRGCDYFLDQTPETADVAGGIDGVAKTNDDHVLRRQYDDSLAFIAKRKKRVTRDPHLDAPLCAFVFAAIAPEAGAVIGVERCGG